LGLSVIVVFSRKLDDYSALPMQNSRNNNNTNWFLHFAVGVHCYDL